MRGSKNAYKRKLYEKVARFCEVTPETVAHVPLFIMRGRREIEVDGCSGILEYESEKIVLSISGDRFSVCGSCLTLEDFSGGVLYVRGNIEAVWFGGDFDRRGECSGE